MTFFAFSARNSATSAVNVFCKIRVTKQSPHPHTIPPKKNGIRSSFHRFHRESARFHSLETIFNPESLSLCLLVSGEAVLLLRCTVTPLLGH